MGIEPTSEAWEMLGILALLHRNSSVTLLGPARTQVTWASDPAGVGSDALRIMAGQDFRRCDRLDSHDLEAGRLSARHRACARLCTSSVSNRPRD